MTIGGCSSKPIEFKEVSEIKAGKDIVFYTSSDLHYLSKSLTDNGEAFDKFVASGDGKQLRYIDEIMETFAYNIEKTKPSVLIISGDLTINGEKQSHLDLAQKFKAIENSGTSIYVIPGNHDILNPYARGFKDSKQYVTDYINAEDFSKIYADFGYNEAVSRDKASLSYLAAPSQEVWLLMLDTNKYKDNIKLKAPQLEGELSEETLNWVKKCGDMAKQKGASIVAVMHHNILDHSEVIREGFTLDNNEEALKVFKENNINLVLSGHIHIQDICADNSLAPELYDIASNSLPIYPHQYGILNFSVQNNSLDYSTRKLDVEAWSKEKGIVDQNLNNFNKYSEDYFGKFAYDMAAKQFSGDSRYSEREIKLMSETMRLLNLRYFAGTENLNSKDVLVSEGFKLWSDSKESFLKRYAMNIFSDKNTEDNSLHIKLNNGETKAYIK